MTGPGHNSHNRAAAKKLRAWVDRLEQLDGEIRDLNGEKSQVFAEVKASGFDPGAVRSALRFRRDPDAAIERNRATVEVLQMLGHLDGAESLTALPAPGPVIDMPVLGTEDATRVHVRETDEDAG